MKPILLFLTLSLFVEHDIPKLPIEPCAFNGENLNEEAYNAELKNYLDCLIDKKLEANNKEDLLKELALPGMSGKWINSPKIYSEKYVCYQSLLKLSNKEDLLDLMKSKYPVLRYYGFLGVAENYQAHAFQALQNMIQDTTVNSGKIGCVSLEKSIADLCIDEVTKRYLYKEENFKSEIYQLSLLEKQELDKLVIDSKLNLAYRNLLLSKTN